ncbi:hypothetical protein UF75_2861 [Desulfosporosinus sp. I2]|nr:hypothetical protein UF75_2861 [Desulfosporosinus sp. I2]
MQPRGANSSCPNPGDLLIPSFKELGLSDLVIRAILNMGFEEATPIQM